MKRFKVMSTVMIAALAALVSCSKDDKGGTNSGEETASVKIQVVYGNGSATRADGPAISDGESLVLHEGHIFFCTPDGIIDTHIGIDNESGGQQVSIADLLGGEAVVSNIPINATVCYMISNDEAVGINITSNLRGANIGSILSNVMLVNSLNDDGGGVENIPLFGTGTMSTTTSGTTQRGQGYQASVNVTLNSLASRIQIPKITGVPFEYTIDGDDHTVTIDEFTIEGIYINNMYLSMTVASIPGLIHNGGQLAENYSTTSGNTSSIYIPGGAGERLADYLNMLSTTNGNNQEVIPTNGAWAYNVFPGTPVPHIIIKFSAVTFTDSNTEITTTTLVDRFVTVKDYVYATGHPNAGDLVTSFEANNIYTFSDIQFNYNNLSVIPEVETINVLVTVTVSSWIDNSIVWNN